MALPLPVREDVSDRLLGEEQDTPFKSVIKKPLCNFLGLSPREMGAKKPAP
jgi:hypothetical protein